MKRTRFLYFTLPLGICGLQPEGPRAPFGSAHRLPPSRTPSYGHQWQGCVSYPGGHTLKIKVVIEVVVVVVVVGGIVVRKVTVIGRRTIMAMKIMIKIRIRSFT